METAQDSIISEIIATIDEFGIITFRHGANVKAIEGVGIKDDMGNFYDAGIDENFIVFAGNVVDVDNTIFTGNENYNKIPHFKVGDKLVLLSYFYNEDYGCGTEINGIYTDWKHFKESQSFKDMGHYGMSTIFVRVNDYKAEGWNGL